MVRSSTHCVLARSTATFAALGWSPQIPHGGLGASRALDAWAGRAAMPANQRRDARDRALKLLNTLATRAGLQALPGRSAGDDVVKLYQSLCATITAEGIEMLQEARQLWCENGGANLEASLVLGLDDRERDESFPGGEEPVPGHVRRHGAFRLRARAFMLTTACNLWRTRHNGPPSRPGWRSASNVTKQRTGVQIWRCRKTLPMKPVSTCIAI